MNAWWIRESQICKLAWRGRRKNMKLIGVKEGKEMWTTTNYYVKKMLSEELGLQWKEFKTKKSHRSGGPWWDDNHPLQIILVSVLWHRVCQKVLLFTMKARPSSDPVGHFQQQGKKNLIIIYFYLCQFLNPWPYEAMVVGCLCLSRQSLDESSLVYTSQSTLEQIKETTLWIDARSLLDPQNTRLTAQFCAKAD